MRARMEDRHPAAILVPAPRSFVELVQLPSHRPQPSLDPSSLMFSDAFLRKLDLLALVNRDRAHGQLRGMHRSRRVGTGMVFADYRPYSEGDDIRHIDWGIYLRLDRLILRLFEEEADVPVYIFVDAS